MTAAGSYEAWHVDGSRCDHDIDLQTVMTTMIELQQDPDTDRCLTEPRCGAGLLIVRFSMLASVPADYLGPAILGTTWTEAMTRKAFGDDGPS